MTTPTHLEIPYHGESFFIDIADGNMVNLNKIYEMSGSPKNQDPRQWVRLPTTKNLIESTNVGKSHILKSKRGENGGTWAHWQLALSYAQYLSPELHIAVNQVFKERLEEIINPELGLKRARERAVKNWQKQGHNAEWIADRESHIESRKGYVKTLLEHEVKPGREVGTCTNKIYKGIFNKDKSEIEHDIRKNSPELPAKINIRDHAKRSSIAAIGLAEALASEEIEEFNVLGVDDCSNISFSKGLSVRMAMLDAKSKAPKNPIPKAVNEKAYKNGIAEARKLLK